MERATSVSCRAARSNSPDEAQHLVEDAADAAAELLDEAAQVGFALLDGCGCGCRLLAAHARPFQRIALEHRDRAGDLADLVGAILAFDRDVALAVGKRGERVRDRGERPGDAADDQQGQDQHQKRGEARGRRHALDRLGQHALVLDHGDADIEDADDLAGRIRDREIGRHERFAEQRGRPLIGLATAQRRLPRMIGGKLGADGAVAVFLFHIGGAAHELPARIVEHEQGRIAADIGHRAIDDGVIPEVRHLGDLGARHRAILHRDLGGGNGLREGQCQRAQIDLDVAQGAIVEGGCQRPIAGADHKRRIHADQQHGTQNRLRAELELRQELPGRNLGHEWNNPRNSCIMVQSAYGRINDSSHRRARHGFQIVNEDAPDHAERACHRLVSR
ncbi:hypothetical protein ABH974_004343 [Bradyrhizobium ottawaense]